MQESKMKSYVCAILLLMCVAACSSFTLKDPDYKGVLCKFEDNFYQPNFYKLKPCSALICREDGTHEQLYCKEPPICHYPWTPLTIIRRMNKDYPFPECCPELECGAED